MDIQPKRRKRNDNPYRIYILEGKHIVEFKDGQGKIQKIAVSNELFEVFNNFELKDKVLLNEEERHFASYDLSDEYINKNKEVTQISMDDDLIMKSTFEKLRSAIETLPDIQKTRIKMFYFDGYNADEIAKLTKCTQHAVRKSIRLGIKKLKEILKK